MSTGMTRLATEWGVSLDGRAEPPECPAVLLEPEPETLAGWEHRARALEKHWREAAAETQGLRARLAAQEAQLAATQAEADMAQAYAAQVAALQVRTHRYLRPGLRGSSGAIASTLRRQPAFVRLHNVGR